VLAKARHPLPRPAAVYSNGGQAGAAGRIRLLNVRGYSSTFLRLDGVEPKTGGPEWEKLALAVAASTADRDEATQRWRKLLPSPA